MASNQIADDFHFSMSIGKGLFNDLLGAALPYKLVGGEFNLTENLRDAARQLQVKERVAGLLEGPQNTALLRVKDRAQGVWQNRREQVYEAVDKLVRIDGDWKVELDKEGSEFEYGQQEIGAEAHVKLIASGRASLLRDNISFPFTIEKRVGAEVHLGDIRYDQGSQAIVGTLKDVHVNLGDNIALRLLNDVLGKVLEQQADQFNPVTMLPKAQLDEMVGGAATSLKLKAQVTDVALVVSEQFITLKVKFGFTQLQISG